MDSLSAILRSGSEDIDQQFTPHIKHDLASILQRKAMADAYCYSDTQALASIDTSIEQEKKFFHHIIQSLSTIMGDPKMPFVLLFDIDGTLTDDGSLSLRPSFPIIYQSLQSMYPHITFGVCSARPLDHLHQVFYPQHSRYFDKSYIFSAHDESYTSIIHNHHSRDDNDRTPSHIKKINSYDHISQHISEKIILVDDVIDHERSNKGHGIPVPSNLCYIGLLDQAI